MKINLGILRVIEFLLRVIEYSLVFTGVAPKIRIAQPPYNQESNR